jgi:hypothetical protein
MKTFPPLNSALIGLARAPPTLALGLAPPPQKKSETTPRDLRNVGNTSGWPRSSAVIFTNSALASMWLPTPSHPNRQAFDFDGAISSGLSRKSFAWTAVVQPSLRQLRP